MPSPKEVRKQSRLATAKQAPPKRAAAPAEAAPTQKEVLRDQPKRRRTLRDEGVEG